MRIIKVLNGLAWCRIDANKAYNENTEISYSGTFAISNEK